ncbi:MAG: hypothetical protein KatS3mg032_0785 [Cyclobacteriaceae bacterium]|nr:MAG: hypothetical protein KatS3mg032_0785 [Cyclobacteriaceae bacterium]
MMIFIINYLPLDDQIVRALLLPTFVLMQWRE